MTTKPLDGRIALITGASAGIGEQTARDLASLGARVLVNARRAEKIDALVASITADGGKAFAVAGDCTTDETIDRMYGECVNQFGREPDLVVVNAGRGLRGSPLNSDPGEWEGIVQLNVVGATRLIRRAALSMQALCPPPSDDPKAWLDHPRDIVVIASSVGKNISPFSSMYGSTKFAVN